MPLARVSVSTLCIHSGLQPLMVNCVCCHVANALHRSLVAPNTAVLPQWCTIVKAQIDSLQGVMLILLHGYVDFVRTGPYTLALCFTIQLPVGPDNLHEIYIVRHWEHRGTQCQTR